MHHFRFLGPTLLVVAVATASAAPTALADSKQVAQQLFDDAKGLMESGKAVQACPMLAESLRLDPAPGTELRLAYCYELIGRTSTAWSMFKTGLAKAKQANNTGRIEFATEHLAAIEPRLSKVTLQLDPPAASLTGLVVKWDGEQLGAAALGVALPVDPGEHSLRVEAPGKKPFEKKVTIVGDAKRETIQIPSLEDLPTSDGQRSEGRGWTPWAIGGAGVIFLGGFVGARVVVAGAQADRRDFCGAQRASSGCVGDDHVSKIQTWGAISYVSGALAVAGIGTGVYLLLKAPSSDHGSVGIGPAVVSGGTGFSIQGSF